MIKQNKRVQGFLRFLNYYVSLGILSLLFEGASIAKNSFLINTFRKFYNLLYPGDVLIYSLVLVSLLSVFLLNYKKNMLIKISGIVNLAILIIGLFWSLALYLA